MTSDADLLTEDFKREPYWWEDAPRPGAHRVKLPATADVLVVGSGYTGLHAALQTVRGGRDTVVLDAEEAGFGCSSRNGGQVSPSIKPSFDDLVSRYGREAAFEICTEGLKALEFINDFIASERLECDWERVGRFHGAHRPAHYERLARELERRPRELAGEAYMVPRTEQRAEIGSDLYHGGTVFPRHAALHPAKYHLQLLQRVEQAGARVVSHCPVLSIERNRRGFMLRTSRGAVRARDVVLATNGYTGPVAPWHRRRVIPIGSYLIATEPLEPGLARTLSPHARVMTDTRKLVFYYRLCPQHRRVVFGGRVALTETDPRVSAPLLHAAMRKIFPQLEGTRITHSWVGFVAYSFDTLPHIGIHDGLYYAMGYCGSGVSLASYLGMRLGLKALGSPRGRTALDGVPFQTRPLYRGNPWFLAPSVLYYKVRDRFNL